MNEFASEWYFKNDNKPIDTSNNRGINALSLLLKARNANEKYKKECMGLKLFHHIFWLNVSPPVFLYPPKYMTRNPAAGIKAKPPNMGKYALFIFLAMTTNKKRTDIHPKRNRINLF